MDYRETLRVLRSEGFDTADIDNAIDSLMHTEGPVPTRISSITMTEEEVSMIRAQLTSPTAL